MKAETELQRWMRLCEALGSEALTAKELALRLNMTEGSVTAMLLEGHARGVVETETSWRLTLPELATAARAARAEQAEIEETQASG